MGNAACCSKDSARQDGLVTTSADELQKDEATLITDSVPTLGDYTINVTLNREEGGGRLGLDVDYMAERKALPIMAINGGISEAWNTTCPSTNKIMKGDSIIEVNGIRNNLVEMMQACKNDKILNMTLVRGMTFDHLMEDLEKLVREKKCGPILICMSWHDAGVFGAGEGGLDANSGMPTTALSLLMPISNKYVPYLISHADLWALAANVATRLMGGPEIPTRFGRPDATSANEGAQSAAKRRPDGAMGADDLRKIFKGFDDRAVVALSGARCLLERSGGVGAQPVKFDNSYFTELLDKSKKQETASKGNPQCRSMDLALTEDSSFRTHVEKYAADQSAFFKDYTEAWIKLQEMGVSKLLRDIL